MKTFNKPFIVLIITYLLSFSKLYGQTSPIQFIENKGQWVSRVNFQTAAGNGAFFLQKNGFTVLQHNPEDMMKVKSLVHGHENEALKNITLRSHAYEAEFLNANLSCEIIPENPIPSVNNYFIGDDKMKWASDCKIFTAVTYKNMYPGIDVKYYADGGGRIKYDIIVNPGSDVSKIAIRYKGADNIFLENKQLVIKTSVGDIRELEPYTYQKSKTGNEQVICKYLVANNIVTFQTADFDHSKTLIIDPTQIFFTYSGSTADNWGYTAAPGPDGSFYSAGIVHSLGFPTSLGAYSSTFNGGQFDIGLIKLSANGKNKIYATYIGGAYSEYPHSLISDNAGNLIMLGRTSSVNFPVTGPRYGSGGSTDIFILKLNASGNELIGSKVIGGTGMDGSNIYDGNQLSMNSTHRNYGDISRSEVILDASNNIYIASSTRSMDFPVSVNSFQSTNRGQQDAVVMKLSPDANTITWSTLLGGAGNDAAYSLALGNQNTIYVAGGTGSTDLNGISANGVISSAFKGGICDGFVLQLSSDGSSILKGTFIGINAADQVYHIQTDKLGKVYVMGTTEGVWPVINAAFKNLNAKQFIVKMQSDLSSYIYSTTFGFDTPTSNRSNISPCAFFVDECENVYVAGWGGKMNILSGGPASNVIGMPVTADAIKSTPDISGSDFYVFVMKRDAQSQLYGSFFGQEDGTLTNQNSIGDHNEGGTSRFDKDGTLYLAMCANCFKEVPFPGTPGSWSPTNQATAGAECNNGMLKIAMGFVNRVVASPVASESIGCSSYTVSFKDSLRKGKQYIWDFGDGTPSLNTTNYDVQHTYNLTGNFIVKLVAIDSMTCNISDSALLSITVNILCPFSVCPLGNVDLIAGLPGSIYQWQQSSGNNNFQNIGDDFIHFTGSSTSTLHLLNVPSSWYGRKYRAVVNGIADNPQLLRIVNNWTGQSNFAWENATNWSCGNIPDVNTDVIITSGTVVINSNVSINSLTLSPGVNFTVNPGFTLTITH